jgi:hypothetical protein
MTACSICVATAVGLIAITRDSCTDFDRHALCWIDQRCLAAASQAARVAGQMQAECRLPQPKPVDS